MGCGRRPRSNVREASTNARHLKRLAGTLTLAHAAGEGGLLNWYAPRDGRESAPPPPPPPRDAAADAVGAAGGGAGTFSAHPFELRDRPPHPQTAEHYGRGCPFGRAAAAATPVAASTNRPVSLKTLIA